MHFAVGNTKLTFYSRRMVPVTAKQSPFMPTEVARRLMHKHVAVSPFCIAWAYNGGSASTADRSSYNKPLMGHLNKSCVDRVHRNEQEWKCITHSISIHEAVAVLGGDIQYSNESFNSQGKQ